MPAAYEKKWAELAQDMTEQPEVTEGKMFGCIGLRTGKKFFAMIWEERLVVKLPKPRIAEVLKAGGEQFSPMGGRVMGDWVIVGTKADWFQLASESKTYVEALLK